MLDLDKQNTESDQSADRVFTRRRVAIVVIGVVVALLAGLLVSFVYTSLDYGGGNGASSGKSTSPAAGKQAYDHSTHLFLGIIKSEGYSPHRRTQVYYIERPGGEIIEVPKEIIDVGQPHN